MRARKTKRINRGGKSTIESCDKGRTNRNDAGHREVNMTKNMVKYLISTIDYGITYGHQVGNTIVGYSDSDWAGCKETSRSTSGYLFSMNGGAISWRSKRQTCVAQSTCEAEYMAVSEACREAVWLQSILSSLTKTSPRTIMLNVDNQGTIALSKNQIQNNRTKHIRIRYHYVKECNEDKLIELVYCHTKDNVSDILTKALRIPRFNELVPLMGLGGYQGEEGM